MDPQATWRELIEAWLEGNWQAVSEFSEALLDWLSKDGFPPETMGAMRLGADWNRSIAVAVCELAYQRASSVLDRPNGIPTDVSFTLACATCNDDGPHTYDEAIADGWKQLQYTPAGISENFLGRCPQCQTVDV